LPIDPVQRVDVPELVRLDDGLVGLPVANDVDDVVLGHRVEVPGLVGQVLVIPLQRSGIDVERDGRHRVEVVAAAHVGDPGRRVASADVEQIRGRIVGPRVPDGATTDLPRIGAPGLAPGLAGGRDRVPAPETLAGRRVEGFDEYARPHLSRPGDADDDLPLNDEGRLAYEVPVAI